MQLKESPFGTLQVDSENVKEGELRLGGTVEVTLQGNAASTVAGNAKSTASALIQSIKDNSIYTVGQFIIFYCDVLNDKFIAKKTASLKIENVAR